MGETYKRRHGVDWSVDMHDVFIDLTVAKKWREYKREYGIEFRDPWVPLLDAARALIPEQYFKVSPWTEEHFHDWVMAEKGCITWGAASTGKALLPDEPVFARVSKYADSAVEYTLRFWTKPEDFWDTYYDVLEACKRAFDDAGIEMTYPHLNVHTAT